MKIITTILILILPVTWSFAGEPQKKVKKLLCKFAEKINGDKGWELAEYGWTNEDKKVKSIVIGFRIVNKPDLTDARRDLIELRNQMISFVNSNKNNGKYFLNFPISDENLDISIIYVNDQKLMRRDGEISFVFMRDEKLDFSKRSEAKLESVHEETLCNALKEIQNEKR